MRNLDDRNRLLLCILSICKDVLGRLPKVVGIDAVEMALWANENTPAAPVQRSVVDGPAAAAVTENDLKVTVERDLISQVKEEDMEVLLGTYVMGIGEAEAFSERVNRELQALEAANVHAILETEPLVNQGGQGPRSLGPKIWSGPVETGGGALKTELEIARNTGTSVVDSDKGDKIRYWKELKQRPTVLGIWMNGWAFSM